MNGQKIWLDGNFVAWKDAKIHILSHVIHYGSGAFEGIRLYETKKNQSVIFRLDKHIERLLQTCNVYRMLPKYSSKQIKEIILKTIKINKVKSAYIRPLVYRGYNDLSINPLKCPISMMIATWDWKKYFKKNSKKEGVSIKISSWHRVPPNTIPSLVKSTGGYLNSQLIKLEATDDGYDEGVALNTHGFIAECSGENIFIVSNKKLITPSINQSILPGITRDAVIKIAALKKIPIEERPLLRDELYMADEIFITGTAAEITHVFKVDHIIINKKKIGTITKEIQNHFFEIIKGNKQDPFNWLTPVY